MPKDDRQKKIIPFTLVLGGGGARGLAHIGVLKALEKNGFFPSLIVGTSMGALVGAMYAQTGSAGLVEEKMRTYLQGDDFNRIGLEQFSDSDNENQRSIWDRFSTHLRQRYLLSRSALGTGMFAQESLLHGVTMLLGESDIRDLPLRFAAVTSDLLTGEEVVFTSGSLVTGVAASCAVLGIVAPVKVGSRHLVDGTVTSTIPVPAARLLSPDPVLAVDVRQSMKRNERYDHGYEVVIRASDITRSLLNDVHLKHADIILKPDVAELNWNQFSRITQCIRSGEQVVEENLSHLVKFLVRHPFRLFSWKGVSS
ncbi:MAG: hypothetical protein EHM64_00395 [Ignavibacteriae bacterium]|nr:MAG: hypothetical protein EHM64_00395 [Ignavibacteriota bacterium]